MSSKSWNGFYAPAYRMLLNSLQGGTISDAAWQACVQACGSNPIAEEHWEFLAVGYLHLVDHADELGPQDGTRLRQLLPRFKNAHPTLNWRLMSKVVQARLANRRLSADDLRSIGAVPDKRGCLADLPRQESTQYHAYILLLMLRFGSDDTTVSSWAKQALGWLVRMWQLHGDPSALGRGRFQLFGYASMAAAAYLAISRNIDVPSEWISAVRTRLAPEHPGGALSSVWTGPFRDKLLYGYNTSDDYATFARLWSCDGYGFSGFPSGSIQELWTHSLDASGSCLIATTRGPVAALIVDPPQPTKKRHAFGLLRSFLRSDADHVIRHVSDDPEGKIFQRGASVVSRTANAFSWRIVPALLRERLVEQGVTLWIPSGGSPTTLLDGAVEVEELQWSRGDAQWRGYRVRAVRNGSLDIQWQP